MSIKQFIPKYCAICGDREAVAIINKQMRGEWHRLMVCGECKKKHEHELEMTRKNFQMQFGEK
jgi:protein-arginine kinase activator protein McsA